MDDAQLDRGSIMVSESVWFIRKQDIHHCKIRYDRNGEIVMFPDECGTR